MYCRGVHKVGSSERQSGGEILSAPAQKASVQGCIEALLTLLVGGVWSAGDPVTGTESCIGRKG